MTWGTNIVRMKFRFSAAHRILGHQGKCRFIHGHNYTALVTVQNNKGLNELGMVVDFSDLKKTVGKWIDDNWDHNLIVHSKDPLLELHESGSVLSRMIFNGREPYVMSQLRNPTAECMTEELAENAQRVLQEFDSNLEVHMIEIGETENCGSCTY